MDRITLHELQTLATPGLPPRISLYVSQQPGYPACNGNPQELRHVLFQAETQLKEAGIDAIEINSLLQSALDLVRAPDLQKATGSKGLALFLAQGFIRTWQLPFDCKSTVDVGSAFRVGPLVRLLSWQDELRVVALCPNNVRYFGCTRSAIRELELPAGIPGSLDQFEGGPDVGRAIRFQSSAGAAGATAIVHGQTSFKDEAKTRLQAYVRTVAECVDQANSNDKLPVVLFAVNELHSVFNAAIADGQHQPVGIDESPAHLSAAEIHDRVIKLFDTNAVGTTKVAFDRYQSALNTHHAASELETIVAAASAGKVDTLIAAYGERVWGIYQAGSDRAIVTDSTCQAPSVDLMELAVSETLRHGGRVCMVEHSATPEQALAVAALRWTT